MDVAKLASNLFVLLKGISAEVHFMEVCHFFFERISERPTSKSCHGPSVKSVTLDVIGTFWRATTKELYGVSLDLNHKVGSWQFYSGYNKK